MPPNYTSIIHTNIPVLDNQPETNRSSNLFRIIHSSLWIDSQCGISDISSEPLPVELYRYFHDLSEIPDEDSLVAVRGILSVRIGDNGITLVIRALHIVQYPGNPEDNNYILGCPSPQLASLTIIGIVGKSIQPLEVTATTPRYFQLKTSIYESKTNSNEYTIVCLYPYTSRFKNTPCPNRHALVSVFGQIIGIHNTSGCLAVLVDDVVFLTTKSSTNEDKQSVGDSSIDTSPKQKWEGWGIRNKKYKALPARKLGGEESIQPDNGGLKSLTPESPLTIVSSPSSCL